MAFFRQFSPGPTMVLAQASMPPRVRSQSRISIHVLRNKGAAMTEEEEKRFKELCLEIIAEKDPSRFTQLVSELDEIMATKDQRLRKATPGQVS